MRWKNGILGGAGLLAALVMAAPLVVAQSEAPRPEVRKRVEIVRGGGSSFLGVTLDDTTGSDRGAVVRKVGPDTPAAKAGLREGDLVTRFDGESVRSAAQLARVVRETPVGRTVAIEVLRGGARQTLQATLAENTGLRRFGDAEFPDIAALVPPRMPEPPEAPEAPEPPLPPRMRFPWNDEGGGKSFLFDRVFERGPRKLGIRYQEIEGQLAKYFKLPGDEGVLVTDVDEDGPAAKAGLKAGDVILQFAGKPVKGSSDLRRGVSDAEAGSEVAIQVQREGRVLDLKVKLAGEKDKGRPHASGEST
jgi:serine protease Do